MITTDYVALSQPLIDGVLLNDRTERKLKLVFVILIEIVLSREHKHGASARTCTAQH